jgi:hypothetical protein
MITRFFILIAFVLLLITTIYKVSCEQEKIAKLKMLSATRDDVGDAEQAVMECNLAVQQIEEEIARLRDVLVQKKVTDLNACKTRFNARIDAYKAVYKSAHGRNPTDAHIVKMKRRLGITI